MTSKAQGSPPLPFRRESRGQRDFRQRLRRPRIALLLGHSSGGISVSEKTDWDVELFLYLQDMLTDTHLEANAPSTAVEENSGASLNVQQDFPVHCICWWCLRR